MKKASEYRHHAEECRALANGMAGEQRDQLLEMAATWEKLGDPSASAVIPNWRLRASARKRRRGREVAGLTPHIISGRDRFRVAIDGERHGGRYDPLPVLVSRVDGDGADNTLRQQVARRRPRRPLARQC